MRHNEHILGQQFSLRPLSDGDADFVVGLRNTPELSKYLHHGATSIDAQLKWQNTYYSRAGDYYFVIENNKTHKSEGLIALYAVDDHASRAEWGRWLILPGSLAAPESALLIYRFGLENLNLQELYCRTVAENRAVVSFHDSCGIPRSRVLSDHFEISGESFDAIEHTVNHALWPRIKERLQKTVTFLARKQQQNG